MQLPIQINFHNLPPSEALEAKIREKVQKLTRITDTITACRVTIDTPHKHHHKGSTYQVTIDLTLPGNEIVVSRDPGLNHAHENAYVAVRDAFNALTRQLASYVRRRQGKSRQHQTHGDVLEV